MKDLSIPIPHFGEDQIAEIELRIGGKKISYEFRVESFSWELPSEYAELTEENEKSLAKILNLKKAIANYDKEWELIQIFTPLENAKRIQVLYRKKNKEA